MTQAQKDRLRAIMRRTPVDALLTSLLAVEASMPPADPENPGPRQVASMVRAWTIEELENRYPVASDAVQAAFDAAGEIELRTGEDVDVNYVDVLVKAVLAELSPALRARTLAALPEAVRAPLVAEIAAGITY